MTVSHQTLAPSVEASHNSEIAWGSCRAFRLDFSPLEGISANFEGKKERGGAGSNGPPFCHKEYASGVLPTELRRPVST